MLSARTTQLAWLLVLLLGCGDDNSTDGPSGGSAAGGNGSAGGGAPTGGAGAGGDPTEGGAPPCSAKTLQEATRVTSITIDAAASTRAITAQSGSASVVAWAGSDGMIHITPLDVVDQRAGADLLVDGSAVFGAAATATERALLVSRPPDYMTFVKVDASGAELSSVDFVGGGDHAVIGTEWFGEFAQTGRLAQLADGSYAAYHALHRRWPDNVGHQGDTLRFLDAAGQEVGGGWDWGCSHSMDQRLAAGPNGLVPICISDCYPEKGIYFNHSAAQITPDPGANCAGGFTTQLGGLVANQAGFFLVYQDAAGAAHLGQFDLNGQPVADRSLSTAGSSRLGSYGTGLLLGSSGAGGSNLQMLDGAGQDSGAPATLTAALPDGDFESRSDGEVAWATASGTTLSVVRVRQCD